MYNILEFLKIIGFFEGDPSCNDENVIIMLAFLPTLLLEGKLKFKSFACAQQNSMGSRKFERRVLVEHTKEKHCRSLEQMAAIKIVVEVKWVTWIIQLIHN